MSAKPMKKGLKIFLIVFIVIVLLGICFGSLALYAKHEFEKDKFWLPYVPQKQSVTELPETAQEAVAYVERLYAEAIVSDEAEGSWRTDVDLGGDMQISLPDADANIVRFIRDNAAGKVAALYPSGSGVLMKDAENVPVLELGSGDVLDYPYDPDSLFNTDGTYKSDEYVIDFTVDPASVDADALKNGDVCKGVLELIAPAASVDGLNITPTAVSMRFKIDRLTDRLRSVEIVRTYDISAAVRFAGEYAALSAEPVEVSLPYKTTQHIDFKWYGARFTQGDIAVTHDDIEMLPVEISVNDGAEKGKDFNLTFTYSVPDLMEVDDEVVLHVHGRHDKDEPITVGMKLEYDGHVYTDEINVYITDLEMVKTGVQFPFKEVEAAVGTSVHLITDLRVPEETKEEDYTLTYETSAPDAVSIDEHGMITVLKAVSGPVTVKVTLDCSGHTYSDEMTVRITAETEGTTNG
ncbi:MAG: hypothetical protein IJK23_11880 [Clostridia bacterium]|nr:hypothetical protein [Clostridia bacterium]